MNPALFWTFAALMLLFAVSVVVQRNPVSSALSLVVCFIALAALYVSLDAFFIGVIQVLVYAGAVMVLFVFIIMLLDLKAEVKRAVTPVALIAGLIVSFGFIGTVAKVLAGFGPGKVAAPAITLPVQDVKTVGMLLFTNYNLPLQIVGVLLLVATVGVIVLSKRELK
ncbi:NADH dehydrogenase [Verrucomicrobia bacterium SCGC AG-212-E04]|nr:NADH dehydrogenase [Verrucomicrobia bacterium SCGC AG-212-E04]